MKFAQNENIRNTLLENDSVSPNVFTSSQETVSELEEISRKRDFHFTQKKADAPKCFLVMFECPNGDLDFEPGLGKQSVASSTPLRCKLLLD